MREDGVGFSMPRVSLLVVLFHCQHTDGHVISELCSNSPCRSTRERIVSRPSGLFLFASILRAALGTAPDRLWEIELSSGIFRAEGLQKARSLLCCLSWNIRTETV